MMVAETKEQHPIEDEVAPLYAFFPPFFFAFIGIELDLGVHGRRHTGSRRARDPAGGRHQGHGRVGGARGVSRGEALFVAAGMVPRGEVGIIVAGIGVAIGALTDTAYAILIGMAILTTLIAPPALRRLAQGPTRVDLTPAGSNLKQNPSSQRGATSSQVSTSPFPFTSTRPRGSVTKSSRTSSQVERVIWITSGTPCDSMRLAMFTVSPQRS